MSEIAAYTATLLSITEILYSRYDRQLRILSLCFLLNLLSGKKTEQQNDKMATAIPALDQTKVTASYGKRSIAADDRIERVFIKYPFHNTLR